jgi:hypothetical protein
MMKRIVPIVLTLLAWGFVGTPAFAQERNRLFQIVFEIDGKRADTILTLRVRQNDHVTEIKYSPLHIDRLPLELRLKERSPLR